MKAKTIFITVEFIIDRTGATKLIDYPENLPIPRKDEFIIFNDFSGRVREIRHITEGFVSEIKIITFKPFD